MDEFHTPGESRNLIKTLRLHKWAHGSIPIQNFREASLSPSRDILLLQSGQCEALLVFLRSIKPSGNLLQQVDHVPDSSPLVSGLFNEPAPARSDSQTVQSFPSTSGENAVRKPFTFLRGAASLCWGSSEDGYSSKRQVGRFKQVLFMVEKNGLYVHGFPKDHSEVDSTTGHPLKIQSNTGLNRFPSGKWINWSQRDIVTADASFNKNDACQNDFVTLLLETDIKDCGDVMRLEFIEGKNQPRSDTILSYSVLYNSSSFASLIKYTERCLQKANGTATGADLEACDARNLTLHKLFSSSSSNMVGMLLVSEDVDADCPMVDNESKPKNRFFILISRVLHSGLEWFSVIDPGKLLSETVVTHWPDFGIAYYHLIGLHEKGHLYIWSLTDATVVADINVLQHCGLYEIKSQITNDLEPQVSHDCNTDDVNTHDLEPQISLERTTGRKFLQMSISVDFTLVAVRDSFALIYVIPIDGYISSHLNLEHSEAKEMSSTYLSSWALGDNPSSLRLVKLYESLKEMKSRGRTCLSGFSSKLNLARSGANGIHFGYNSTKQMRRVLMPVKDPTADVTLCINPFGIMQMLKSKEDKEQKVVLQTLNLLGDVSNKCKKTMGLGFLNLDLNTKQHIYALSFPYQGYLYLVSQDGLYVVLPPLSVRKASIFQGEWWFTGIEADHLLGQVETSLYQKQSQSTFEQWQIELLDKLLIFDDVIEAERLAEVNGWSQQIVKLRRLQLALDYAQLEFVEVALNGLLHVGAAQYGVPRVLFTASELILNKSSGDAELGKASRLLSLAARFVIKLIGQYGLQHGHKKWKHLTSSATALPLADANMCHHNMYEMSHFLVVIRKMQYQLQMRRVRPQPGKKDIQDESVAENSQAIIAESSSIGKPLQNASLDVNSNEAKAVGFSRQDDSMWLVRGANGEKLTFESSSEMFHRWEKEKMDLSRIVREALRVGRLPLAVVQLHRLRSRELVYQPQDQNVFKEVQGIGRTFVYELFCKGEASKAMIALSRLGEDIETVLRELAFGTVSRFLRSQVTKELARLGCLNGQDLEILGTVSILERSYPSSSFWRSYGMQQKSLPSPAKGINDGASDNADLQLVCSMKGSYDITIRCGEINGVILGNWGAQNMDVDHTSSEELLPGYWAGAAVWLNVWDKRTLDRVYIDLETVVIDEVSWEACLEMAVARHDLNGISSLLDSLPDTVLKEGELRVRLDCTDETDDLTSVAEHESKGDHKSFGLDVDAVEMVIPRVKFLSVPLGSVCTDWIFRMVEEKLAQNHIFLRSYWSGTRELLSLLARSGLLTTRYSEAVKSRKKNKFQKETQHAIHELVLRYCVRHSLPNMMGFYMDFHALALDPVSSVIMQAVVGDCQWALWLLLSRIKGREYDASFANALTILAHNFSPGSLSSVAEVDEFISTVDDMAMAGGEMMALCTLMYAPVALEKCLCTGSVNKHGGPTWQCTLENLHPMLQQYPTLWHTLLTASVHPNTWFFTSHSRIGKPSLSGYLQWREQIYSSACGDTSLLQMMPRWLPKDVKRLLQLAIQGPVGGGQSFLQGWDESALQYNGRGVDPVAWEMTLQKCIESELYGSSMFEEKEVGVQHHLRRGRAMAAFNSILALRLQNFHAPGSVIREHVGKFQRGHMHLSSEVHAILSPLTIHEEKYLASVLPLAIMNFENPVVVAACASFLELCGLPATMLRVDVAALCRISTFCKSNDSSDIEIDWSCGCENDIASALARALADEYMEAGISILMPERSDASGKHPALGKVNRTLKKVLEALEKSSFRGMPNMDVTPGSWLMNGVGDGSHLRALQRESSERWSLVTAFCNIHHLPISTVYLTALARDNDWVGFLAEAQSECCPLELLISVASKEFTDSRLRSHILTVLRSSQSAWQKMVSHPVGLPVVGMPQEDASLRTTDVATSELFEILAECENKKCPGSALLSKSKDLRWPFLAVIASCFTDVTPVSCLTAWLEITAARETSSIKVNDAAAHIATCVSAAVEATNALPESSRVVDFRYNRKNAKRRKLSCGDNIVSDHVTPTSPYVSASQNTPKEAIPNGKKSTSDMKQRNPSLQPGAHDVTEEQESLSKMIAILCEQQHFSPLLRAFELFWPSSSLLPFLRFLQAFGQMRLSEATDHLALFPNRLKEELHQTQFTPNKSARTANSWIASAAITAANSMLRACPSAYEQRRLLQLLSGTDFGDGGVAAKHFRRLQWKIQLAEPTLQDSSGSVIAGSNIDDDALLQALEKQGKWEEARIWAQQLELSGENSKAVHHVTETQAECMVAEWREILWDIPEERVALWNHCQTLFVKHSLPPHQAGLFFLRHAEAIEQEITPSELHRVLLLALQWLSGAITNTPPCYPIHQLRELETRIWLLAVESEIEIKNAKGERTALPSKFIEGGRSDQNIGGVTNNVEHIPLTANLVSSVDNHIQNVRVKSTEFSSNERDFPQTRIPQGQDVNSSGVPKVKRKPKSYAQHRRTQADKAGKSHVDQDGINCLGVSPVKKGDLRSSTVSQEVKEESTASDDHTCWEERVGEQELERAVLSLLEVGQISAARQLQQKLAPNVVPLELLLVETAINIAMMSQPTAKGFVDSTDIHPLVVEHLISLNLVADITATSPLELLESITTACRKGCGQGSCRRIGAVARVAQFLEIPFSDAFEKSPTHLLQLLSLKAQDSLSEAKLLVETHSIPAASIAKILAESFLKGLLAAHRGGYMESLQPEDGPSPLLWRPSDFLKWAELCKSQPEMGHALMGLLISGHDIPHACEVELLVRAHDFYVKSACLDGIDVLLSLASTRVDSYLCEGDFMSLARLVTGINNFQSLHFMLDVLIENGQLDLLLQRRGIEAPMESSASVRGFRMAVLSTLKRFSPGDLEAFAKVYAQFDMKHEMAAHLQSRALSGRDQLKIENIIDQSEDLLEMMRYHVEAAEVWASVDAGNKARWNCAQASLISLQLRIPEKLWLNLNSTNSRRLFVDQSRFQEALVVAEAYNLNQPGEWVPVLWNQMQNPGWIDQFLGEFVAVLPLTSVMLTELARFYRAEVSARERIDFSSWLTPGGLPLEWAKYLEKSFRCLLKYVRDVRLRVQLATMATGFPDVLDVCMRILDKVPETAGPLILRKGHGGGYLPVM